MRLQTGMNFRQPFILTAALLVLTGCAGFTEKISGLKTLSALGQSEKIKQQALNQETKNFRKIEKAVAGGVLQEGQFSHEVRMRYGDPVVVVPEGRMEKWVYKPGYEDWMGGERIELYFDENAKLAQWLHRGAPGH